MGGLALSVWLYRLRRVKVRSRMKVPLALSQVVSYTVTLPRSFEWNPANACEFMKHLLVTYQRGLAFRISAVPGSIDWQVLLVRPEGQADVVSLLGAIRSFYPEAEVSSGSYDGPGFGEPFYRAVIPFEQLNLFPAPTLYVGDLKDFDPLNTLTQAMSTLQAGERISYILYVADYAHGASEAGSDLVTASNVHPLEYSSIGGAIGAELRRSAGADKVPVYQARFQTTMENKLASPLYSALLMVQVDSPSKERLRELAMVSMHVVSFSQEHFNVLSPVMKKLSKRIVCVESEQEYRSTGFWGLLDAWLTNQNRSWKKHLLVLEPRELAALWHLPCKSFAAPGISWLSGKRTSLPAVLKDNREHVYLGDNLYAGRETPVYMRNENRATHMIVFGKTDMGKSTLLHNLAHQDIAQGRGGRWWTRTGTSCATFCGRASLRSAREM